MYKLAFIGVGNMGGALLDACAKVIDGRDILIADSDSTKTAKYRDTYGCAVGTVQDAASSGEFIFLGVKPQMAQGLFDNIRSSLNARQTHPILISMMAGITMEKIQDMAELNCPVIRIMPNVAAAVGEAMILCSSLSVGGRHLQEFCDFMKEAGKLDFIEEKLIDAGTAVQGCGPAYICMLVEAMADGAVRCGLPRQKAYDYAIQTLRGTAALLESTGKHPGEVKDMVTSPAGSTIEGVAALEENNFRHAVMEAVVKAYEKNKKF